jgi:hypothetical protein
VLQTKNIENLTPLQYIQKALNYIKPENEDDVTLEEAEKYFFDKDKVPD